MKKTRKNKRREITPSARWSSKQAYEDALRLYRSDRHLEAWRKLKPFTESEEPTVGVMKLFVDICDQIVRVPATAFLARSWTWRMMFGKSPPFRERGPYLHTSMPKPSITEKRRKAIALVLEDKLSPTQAGRALNFTRPAVERWVREYLARHPDGPPPESSYARACLVSLSPPQERMLEPCSPSPTPVAAFVAIRLDDEVVPAPPSPITVEILTGNGFVMRLQLPTVYDVAMLLRSLEAESC
jgi:hypothetical protein